MPLGLAWHGAWWGPGHSTRLNSIALNHECCYNKANQQTVESKSLDTREIYISQRQVALHEARYVVRSLLLLEFIEYQSAPAFQTFRSSAHFVSEVIGALRYLATILLVTSCMYTVHPLCRRC
jgi:hypothetical protein